jgi:hypothetical protein
VALSLRPQQHSPIAVTRSSAALSGAGAAPCARAGRTPALGGSTTIQARKSWASSLGPRA